MSRFLRDSDDAIREQAFNILRNLAEDEDSIDMIFQELVPEVLLNHIASSLSSTDENVVLQVCNLLLDSIRHVLIVSSLCRRRIS